MGQKTNKLLRAIIAVGLVLFALLFASFAHAQTPAQPTDPLETGWNVSVNGGYSSINNAGTNNGFFFSTGIRIAQHWVTRGDVYVLNSPAVTVSLFKPEYRFSALHLFKNATSPVTKNTEFFLNAGLGSAHYTDASKSAVSKIAYSFGGGLDIKVSDTMSVRPLDVSYVNSNLIGGGRVLGNHVQFAAGLGLRF